MINQFSILKNEQGSVLLLAIMMMMLLTLIGIAATTTSTIEIQISGNDKFHKMAFYNTDAGVYAIPKIISRAINKKATPDIGSSFDYLKNDGTKSGSATYPDFFEELSGLKVYDAKKDISFKNDGVNLTEVDVERLEVVTLAGGGAEYASGADGGGSSLKGIYFGIDSFGKGPNNSESNLGARYLKVVGAAGGM